MVIGFVREAITIKVPLELIDLFYAYLNPETINKITNKETLLTQKITIENTDKNYFFIQHTNT